MSDNNSETVVYRPSTLSAGLPFSLRSVGRARWRRGFHTPERVLNFAQVIWSASGTGAAVSATSRAPIPAGTLAAFLPGRHHQLIAESDEWRCHWFTLDGPAARAVVSGLDIGMPAADIGGHELGHVFRRLERSLKKVGRAADLAAAATVFDALAEMAGMVGGQKSGDVAAEFAAAATTLMDEHFNDPRFGVIQMAEEMGMDRREFSRQFHGCFGLPPREHIMVSRLQLAMSLLSSSSLPVGAISARCGFRDANYFAKFFAARMGMSPSQFRSAERTRHTRGQPSTGGETPRPKSLRGG